MSTLVPVREEPLPLAGSWGEHHVGLLPKSSGEPHRGTAATERHRCARARPFLPWLPRARPGAEPFLEFVVEHLALTDVSPGRVLDMAAATFGADEIELDGAVLSAWRPLPEGGPDSVVYVDLEGYDPQQPWLLDARFVDRPLWRLSDVPEFRPVVEAAVTVWQPPPDDPVLAGGLRVDAVIRSMIRAATAAWLAGEGELPPDPFAPEVTGRSSSG